MADFWIRWAVLNWGGGRGGGVGAEPQQEPQSVALELCQFTGGQQYVIQI